MWINIRVRSNSNSFKFELAQSSMLSAYIWRARKRENKRKILDKYILLVCYCFCWDRLKRSRISYTVEKLQSLKWNLRSTSANESAFVLTHRVGQKKRVNVMLEAEITS